MHSNFNIYDRSTRDSCGIFDKVVSSYLREASRTAMIATRHVQNWHGQSYCRMHRRLDSHVINKSEQLCDDKFIFNCSAFIANGVPIWIVLRFASPLSYPAKQIRSSHVNCVAFVGPRRVQLKFVGLSANLNFRIVVSLDSFLPTKWGMHTHTHTWIICRALHLFFHQQFNN